MIYAGFYTEMLACNPLNPIKLTMVSPSQGNRQLAKDCSPSNPMRINDRYYLDLSKIKYIERCNVVSWYVFSISLVLARVRFSIQSTLKKF